MNKLGIPTDGGADGVTVLKQGFNVEPLIQKQADCISTMTYNEYWQVIDAGYQAGGPGRLQLRGPGRRDRSRTASTCWRTSSRTRPSSTRWRVRHGLDEGLGLCARQNPDEAAKIVLDNDATGAQTEKHQKRMMGEINKLDRAAPNGTLDPSRLRAHGGDPARRRLGPGHHQGAGRRLDATRSRTRPRGVDQRDIGPKEGRALKGAGGYLTRLFLRVSGMKEQNERSICTRNVQ